MKVVIATDSFKGSMSSIEVAKVIESEIRKKYSDAEIVKLPIADGGEGTVDSLVHSLGGERIEIKVNDPLFREITAVYGYSDRDKVAVIEMAASSGLTLLNKGERNPLMTSTYGFGTMILDALDRGAKRIILGLGGSATNDGGVGMAEALGIRFYDANGNRLLRLCGKDLIKIFSVDITGIDPRVKSTEFIVASDVKNPLLGADGATLVYGPQKGAGEDTLIELESGMENYRDSVKKSLKKDFSFKEGAGAAGGLGFATMTYLDAELVSGIDLVLEVIRFEEKILDADLIITGEGRVDSQSIFGQAPMGVLEFGKKLGKDVFAVAGIIDHADELVRLGFKKAYSVVPEIASVSESMGNPEKYLRELVRRAINEYKEA